MKRICHIVLLLGFVLTAWAQGNNALEQVKADPRKAYGTDYPYPQEKVTLTKAPSGYTPFYISHYGRHGSRYYWNDVMYREVDSVLTKAHALGQLTPVGERFREKYDACKKELALGVSELSDLGWEQHQFIARTMYNNFPEVFKNGGDVYAISSLVGRCVMSMAAFCLELTQQNPKIEIREESARKVLDGVKPDDRQNPLRKRWPRSKPRYEKNRSQFTGKDSLREMIIPRVFTSTEGLPGTAHHIGSNLINLYTSLPSIGHEGIMEGIITDEELAARWETENLGGYSWVFGPRYDMIPILQDIIKKADDVVTGKTQRVADLRFGHDTCLGPLTVLMGINGADKDPENPYDVKDCYQTWETCKASNMQLIFYHGKKQGQDILVKCLLNGQEATLPLPADQYPYYRWQDFKQFFTERINGVNGL